MDSDDENVITYGTPLEYEDTEDEVPRKKPVPIEHQVVKDERGLRRFHGAFTGGFSAGYFNTAGSKEGWIPAAFLSSRSSRAKKGGQRPEDFMDAEDLGEFGIAPRSIHVTKEFREENKADSSRKRVFDELFGSAIPGIAPLKDFIVPVRDSIGVKILKNMGWKPGQGIGPRVKFSQKLNLAEKRDNKREKSGEKVYGCSLPTNLNQEDVLSDSEEITFAPDDVTVKLMTTKENLNGLGYTGLSKTPILATFRDETRREVPVVDKNRKLAISGEAFGVGAFEDEDESIYTFDDINQYDFELADATESDIPSTQKPKGSDFTNYIGTILEGFHLSSKPMPSKQFYPPPFLPKTFQPFHRVATSEDKSVDHDTHKKDETANFQKINAIDRAALVDNKTSLVATGSVFDLLKPEDKIRLQNMRNAINSPQSSVVDADAASSDKQLISRNQNTFSELFTPLEHNSSAGVFKPFGQNADKQKRYEIYMKLKDAKKEDEFWKCQPSTMTEWEKQRECEEFQRSADIYKPLSHQMASRFVSAKYSDLDGPTPNIIAKPKSEEPGKSEEKAALVKMKRACFEWHPDRLLCRRFNIPNPYPESQLVGILKVKHDKYSIFNFLTQSKEPSSSVDENSAPREIVSTSTDGNISEATNEKHASSPPRGNKKESNLFSGLLSGQLNSSATVSKPSEVPQVSSSSEDPKDQEQEEKRPPMDLFKAIFEDSESDDETSENENKELNKHDVDIEPKTFLLEDVIPKQTLQPTNSVAEKHSKVASGVFGNIDLDNVNKRPSSMIQSTDTKKLPSIAVQVPKTAVQEVNGKSRPICDYYGPSLPPPAINASTSETLQLQLVTDSDSYTWEEAKPKKHKHKHKKTLKKKHAKTKHKRRKHRSSEEGSSSSSDEEEIDNSRLEELYKKSKLLKSHRK